MGCCFLSGILESACNAGDTGDVGSIPGSGCYIPCQHPFWGGKCQCQGLIWVT